MSDSMSQTPLTPLDQESFSGPIQILKALVPHLDPCSGKKLAMLARIGEFVHTMNLFEEKPLSICSTSDDIRPNIEDILKDIRKYCGPNEVSQIDQFINLINTVRFYNQYNELFNNADISNMMNQMNSIKNMNLNISQDQLQILKNILHAQNLSSNEITND